MSKLLAWGCLIGLLFDDYDFGSLFLFSSQSKDDDCLLLACTNTLIADPSFTLNCVARGSRHVELYLIAMHGLYLMETMQYCKAALLILQ
jgi:hypothetical protein